MAARSALLLILASSALAAIELREATRHWDSFRTKFPKLYTTSEENHRFKVFRENLAEIERLNAEHPLAHFEINQWADLTPEERSARFGRLTPVAKAESHHYDNLPVGAQAAATPNQLGDEVTDVEEHVWRKRATLPANYTSPYVTVAKSQGGCGSCWTFSAAGAAEAAWKKSTGTTVDFAEQQILDCESTGNGGCSGGYESEALKYLVDATSGGGGFELESDYKYTYAKGNCSVNASKAVGKFVATISFTFNESSGGNTEYMLYNNGPLTVALNANTLSYYSSGILTNSSSCWSWTNHAVLLIGWGVQNGVKYWRLKNSWGSGWGESGTFRLARGSSGSVGACQLQESIFIVPDGSTMTPLPACGTRQCGTMDTGSSSLSLTTCGWCAAGTTCSVDGACKSMVDSSKWIEMFGTTGHFTVTTSGTTTSISAPDNTTSQYFLKWNTSSSWVNKYWTSATVYINAQASGSVGVGLTDAVGSANGVFWQVKTTSYTSGSASARATISVCVLSSQKKTCQDVATNYVFPMRRSRSLTAYFVRNNGYVATWFAIAGSAVSGAQYVAIPSAKMASAGEMFIVSSGGSKYFTSPATSTRTRFSAAATTYCITNSAWRTEVKTFLGIPDSVVLQSTTAASDSGVCAKAYGTGSATVQDVIFADATTASLTSPSYGTVPNHMASMALYNRLVAYANAGSIKKYWAGGFGSFTLLEHYVNTSNAVKFSANSTAALTARRDVGHGAEPVSAGAAASVAFGILMAAFAAWF